MEPQPRGNRPPPDIPPATAVGSGDDNPNRLRERALQIAEELVSLGRQIQDKHGGQRETAEYTELRDECLRLIDLAVNVAKKA